MNKEHVTKGPVTAERMLIGPNDKDRRSGYVVNGPDPEGGGLPVRICDLRSPQGMNGTAKAEANAELIAEAFNVLHDTGMTPRELAEAVGEMRKALKSLADTAFDVSCANGDPVLSLELDPATDYARTILSKHQPVTRATNTPCS